tara:strand:- start:898 stop:1146 length:249 start_codon:yes stop_codon:yes gene_type:complete
MPVADCPLECIRSGCPEHDWLEKHDGFVITLIGSVSAALGVIFSYCIRSRCKKISTPCITCDREVIEVEKPKEENTGTNNNI